MTNPPPSPRKTPAPFSQPLFKEMHVEGRTILELQKSLAMSVKQLVRDKISRLGLSERARPTPAAPGAVHQPVPPCRTHGP